MNDQQIAAERKRFEAFVWLQWPSFELDRDEYQYLDVDVQGGWEMWRERSDIAHAEQAELQAEIDRLRGWKESAMSVLSEWHEVWESLGKPGSLGSSSAKESKKESERLRERIRWFAKGLLWDRIKHGGAKSSREAWEHATAEMLELAHEAGCWFDDDGNEVPLEVWKGRVKRNA